MKQLVTAYEASRVLKCKKSYLQKMVHLGFLPYAPLKEYKKQHPKTRAQYVFYSEDILRLKEEREKRKERVGHGLPIPTEILSLRVRLTQLEQQLAVMAVSVGMVPYTLPSKAEDVLAVYSKIERDLERDLSAVEKIEWCHFLLKVDDNFFALAHSHGVLSPWKPFISIGQILSMDPIEDPYIMLAVTQAMKSLKAAVYMYERPYLSKIYPDEVEDEFILAASIAVSLDLRVQNSHRQTWDET